MRRLLLAGAALLAVVVFCAVLLGPPAPDRLDTTGWGDLASRTVAGAYHVHTNRSDDGAADKPTIAAAAARAGLQFIIFTDHGNGTAEPDRPAYLSGVLCLDGVEISTADGHYVALDMARAPYPLGGRAEDVVADVARLGGFGIAAHPDSPKRDLQWNSTAPVDGIEWLNADTEWRDEDTATLAGAALVYAFRPGPAIASLLDRPSAPLHRWDERASNGPVVGLAALDAHGRYEAMFRTFSIRLPLETPLSGNADRDGPAVMAAIRAGRVFTTIDATAAPGLIEYYAEHGGARVPMGARLAAGTPVTLHARVLAPGGSETSLIGRNTRIARGGSEVRAVVGEPGAYRVEVSAPGSPGRPPVPWLVSNPIYVLPPSAPPKADPVASGVPLTSTWRVEHDPLSKGVLDHQSSYLDFSYTLGAGERRSQFVAAVADLPPNNPAFEALTLRAVADRPMRVSMQLRFGDRAGGRRWGRSVYLSPSEAAVTLRVADLAPMEPGDSQMPGADRAQAVLLVADLTNAVPGDSGRLRIQNVSLVRSVLVK
jgi:hypothetical protein